MFTLSLFLSYRTGGTFLLDQSWRQGNSEIGYYTRRSAEKVSKCADGILSYRPPILEVVGCHDSLFILTGFRWFEDGAPGRMLSRKMFKRVRGGVRILSGSHEIMGCPTR